MLITEVKRMFESMLVDTEKASIGYQTDGEIDTGKTNIFPFVNMDYQRITQQDAVFRYEIAITILGKRMNSGKLTTDYKTDYSNADDNVNDCFIIANQIIQFIRNHRNTDPDSVVDPVLTIVRGVSLSKLDGVTFMLDFRVLNTLPCL